MGSMDQKRATLKDSKGTVMGRAVYDGSSLVGVSVPTGYSLSALNMDSMRIVNIRSGVEYSQGCKVHTHCSGHLCRTPQGTLCPTSCRGVRDYSRTAT